MNITVITVCYNAEKTIEQTIQSVINQNYENFEYIIIDGKSTDKTVEIIKKYQKIFPIVLKSEKDEGIYDAMNKGVSISTGEYINFMNSGDFFYNKNILCFIEKYLDNEIDIIYGNTEILYKDFKLINKEPKPENLWMGRTPHQSSFIKSSTMKKYNYNINNKIVADLEFFMNVYYNNGKIKKIEEVISSFSKDGITEILNKQVIRDSYKTVKKYKKNITVDIYYTILKIKPLIKPFVPKFIFKYFKTKSIW